MMNRSTQLFTEEKWSGPTSQTQGLCVCEGGIGVYLYEVGFDTYVRVCTCTMLTLHAPTHLPSPPPPPLPSSTPPSPPPLPSPPPPLPNL